GGGVGAGPRPTSGVVLAYDDAPPLSRGHPVSRPPLVPPRVVRVYWPPKTSESPSHLRQQVRGRSLLCGSSVDAEALLCATTASLFKVESVNPRHQLLRSEVCDWTAHQLRVSEQLVAALRGDADLDIGALPLAGAAWASALGHVKNTTQANEFRELCGAACRGHDSSAQCSCVAIVPTGVRPRR